LRRAEGLQVGRLDVRQLGAFGVGDQFATVPEMEMKLRHGSVLPAPPLIMAEHYTVFAESAKGRGIVGNQT
jgi:hypothetical protein